MVSKRIWTVCSGKGGVGKTFIVSSLGLAFARQNSKTLLVDLDLNGANLHTTLGEPLDKHPDFVNSTTPWNQVRTSKTSSISFIQGFSNFKDSPPSFAKELIEHFRELPFQDIIVDLGPGSDPFYLELLRLSDEKIFVTTPEPASIEKNYRLIENFILHCLQTRHPDKDWKSIKGFLSDFRSTHQPAQRTLKKYIQTQVGLNWDEDVFGDENPFRLIVNQGRGDRDCDIGRSIKTICHHYYDVTFDESTTLTFDNAVWQSFRSMEAVLLKYPFSPLAGQFHGLARKYLQQNLNSQSDRVVV